MLASEARPLRTKRDIWCEAGISSKQIWCADVVAWHKRGLFINPLVQVGDHRPHVGSHPSGRSTKERSKHSLPRLALWLRRRRVSKSCLPALNPAVLEVLLRVFSKERSVLRSMRNSRVCWPWILWCCILGIGHAVAELVAQVRDERRASCGCATHHIALVGFWYAWLYSRSTSFG